MNNLENLIMEYEKENPGKKAFARNYNKYGNEQPPTYNNEFVKWQANEIEKLASRPTCGKEQRLFLDEIENKAEVDHCYYEPGDPHPGFFLIFDDCDFGKIDLQKVIKGG